MQKKIVKYKCQKCIRSPFTKLEHMARSLCLHCCLLLCRIRRRRAATVAAAAVASDVYDGPIMPLANRLLELIKWSQTPQEPSSEDKARRKMHNPQ